jgi:hypothetical protein
MMMTVVDEGTAKPARMPGYSIAGKTGTAQKIGPEGTYAANRYVASFVGFVPASRPALTILVVLDEPRGSLYHGGDIAAPVFRRIALPALRYLGVPPEPGRFLEEGDEPTLLAAAHARRWTEPIPLDEKELKAEQLQEERARLKEMLARRRSAPNRDDDDAAEAPVIPARKPLPSPVAVVAGDAIRLADLQGQSLRGAVSYLGSIGLSARLVASADDVAGSDGVIVMQEPVAGSELPRGSEVSLRLGRFLPAAPRETKMDTSVESAPDARMIPANTGGTATRLVPARRATH